jgi:hypothetical protein
MRVSIFSGGTLESCCGFGIGEGEGQEGKSLLFVNKKKQKNFLSLCVDAETPALPRAGSKRVKVFWFFFSKKELLAFLSLALSCAGGFCGQCSAKSRGEWKHENACCVGFCAGSSFDGGAVAGGGGVQMGQ